MDIENLNLTDKQKQLIEKLGVLNERNGFQPAAASILALLLVADRPELSFDQIRESLNLSKSATSNALNLLISVDMVEYVTHLGERKRYFKRNIKRWENQIKDSITSVMEYKKLFSEILDQRPDSTPELNSAMKEAVEFMDFINDQLPAIYEKWEKHKLDKTNGKTRTVGT